MHLCLCERILVMILVCSDYRKDWGAVILVDERFAKGAHYTKGTRKLTLCV